MRSARWRGQSCSRWRVGMGTVREVGGRGEAEEGRGGAEVGRDEAEGATVAEAEEVGWAEVVVATAVVRLAGTAARLRSHCICSRVKGGSQQAG